MNSSTRRAAGPTPRCSMSCAGTVAFVAGQAARTGDMKFITPSATLGIRGTTGVVGRRGRCGRTEDQTLSRRRRPRRPHRSVRPAGRETRRAHPGRKRLCAQGRSGRPARRLPFQISPQEAARDRGVVQRLFASHNVGRQQAIQRRQLRRQNLPRPNQQRPNQLRQNIQRQPGAPQQPGRPLQQQPARAPRERQPRGNPLGPSRR
jgi:hypothetical protein